MLSRILALILFLACSVGVAKRPSPAAASTSAAHKARVVDGYGALPLRFEANGGQFAAPVKFVARGSGYSLALRATDALFRLQRGRARAALRMQFVGANPHATSAGLEPLPGESHYLTSADPRAWRTHIRNYGKVRYQSLYPGIDLIYYGQQRQLEYDLVVAPGAKVRAIKLRFTGARRVRIGADGALRLQVAGGELRQQPPFVYQVHEGVKQRIAARFVRRGKHAIGFAVAAHDRARPLVIDPALSYATYLGGTGAEAAKGIAVDAAGNAYLAGYTASADFTTTPGAWRTSKSTAAADIFITKLNPAGTAFVYATYLGGHQTQFCCVAITTDGGRTIDLAVDAAGAVYVTGNTTARDFPTTPNAFLTTHGNNCPAGAPCHDTFVTKLNPAGNALVYSTFLGSSGFSAGTGIAVDASGNAYVSGVQNQGGSSFVAKLNANGTARMYSITTGGIAYAVAVDAGGNAYVTGSVPAGFGPDAFVAKINPAGSGFVYNLPLGGNGFDSAYDIAVDAQGSAYVTGYTFSRNFPVTPQALQTTHSGADQDGFVTKLTPAGTLAYSTYLGGASLDLAYGIAVDAGGRAAVTGSSASPNFPVTANAFAAPRFGAFVALLDASGGALDYASFLAGTGVGYGVAFDAQGNLYLMGESASSELPVTANAVQRNNRGGGDVFVAKLSDLSVAQPTTIKSVAAASYTTELARGAIVAAFGPNLTTLTREAAATPLPTSLGGVTIKVRDSLNAERLAPLFFVSPNQVNYLLPPETALGAAKITLERGAGMALETVNVAAVAPGLFTANANGRDVATAVALRVGPFGMTSFEPVARFDPQQNRFVAIPLNLNPESDQVFLLLFGSGVRNRASLAGVSATIGGVPVEVTYAGSQPSFAGLDQINVRLPRTLAGRGDVEVVLNVEGKTANPVRVNIR